MRNAAGHPVEMLFRPGEQSVADDVANHPYIKDQFADGCIQTPGAPPPSPQSAHATMTREPTMFAITAHQRSWGT